MKKSIATLFLLFVCSVSIFADGVIETPGRTPPPPVDPPASMQTVNVPVIKTGTKANENSNIFDFWTFIENFFS